MLPITQSDLQLSTSLEIMRELFIKRMMVLPVLVFRLMPLTMLELKMLTVKLYNNQDDAVSGINTVGLGNTLGIGLHTLQAAEKKAVLSKVVVANGGSNYTNNEREIPEFDAVRELELFESESCGDPQSSIQQQRCYPISPGTLPVEGLESNKDYFVSKIDNKTFQTVEVGIGSTARDEFWNKNIVEIDSGGNGSFNHKPIVVTVEGATGVSTLTGQDFNAVVQPIVRGEIFSVDRVLGGVGYGASTVYNLERQPDLAIEQGENAEVGVVINNGTIVEVNVSRPGHKYGLHRNLSLRMRVKVRLLTDTDHHQHWIFGKSHCC